jgi:hypothetical protein
VSFPDDLTWQMETLTRVDSPVVRGPFTLDETFFTMRARGFWDPDYPDVSFAFSGNISNATHMFRPCLANAPEGCNETCVWRELTHFEGELPKIYIGFDDNCFSDYLPSEDGTVDLYAFVGTSLHDTTRINTTMEKGLTDFVSESARNTIISAEMSVMVAMTLDMDIDDWTYEHETTIVDELAALLQLFADDVLFVSVKAASVIVTVQIVTPDGAMLAAALQALVDDENSALYTSTTLLAQVIASVPLVVEQVRGPQETGPFYLDRSFFERNFTRFFEPDQPDARFLLNGAANGSYVFRPCFHTPPNFIESGGNLTTLLEQCSSSARGVVQSDCEDVRPPRPPEQADWRLNWSELHKKWNWTPEGVELPTLEQTVWVEPDDNRCQKSVPGRELCVWRDVKHYENNPPAIEIAFDDPCFSMYPPDNRVLPLFAWVTTDGGGAELVSVSMEKGIAWQWLTDVNVDLLSVYSGNATGVDPRSLVDTGSTVTSLDVRAYTGLANAKGLDIYDGSRDRSTDINQIGDVNAPSAFLIPPPPPSEWGPNMWLKDLSPHYRQPDNATAGNSSCSDSDTPCLNGGTCRGIEVEDKQQNNPLQFEDGAVCACPYEFGGQFCEIERFVEVDEWTPFSPEIYNLTLNAKGPRGAHVTTWSELVVWDTNECLLANGGCGHPLSAYW